MPELAVANRAEDAARLEHRLHERLRATFGLRILDRIGWARMLRVVAPSLGLIDVALVGDPHCASVPSCGGRRRRPLR